MDIEIRTSFWCSDRQVVMPNILRFRKQFMLLVLHLDDTFRLLWCACVAWIAVLIQSTFVTYLNRTVVVWEAMPSYHKLFCDAA